MEKMILLLVLMGAIQTMALFSDRSLKAAVASAQRAVPDEPSA